MTTRVVGCDYCYTSRERVVYELDSTIAEYIYLYKYTKSYVLMNGIQYKCKLQNPIYKYKSINNLKTYNVKRYINNTSAFCELESLVKD